MEKSSIHYKILHYQYLPKIFIMMIFVSMNWLFQGILYMDRTEKTFKLMSTFFPAFCMILYFYYYYPINHPIVTSFFVAHSFNWTFNGHFFGLIRYFGINQNEPQTFINYANKIRRRASEDDSICFMAVYGSLSRGEIKPTSDLDVRIVRNLGFTNGLKACMFGFKERSRAFLNQFPLDIYILDSFDSLSKMRNDEFPSIVYDSQNGISKTIPPEEFIV